MSSAKSNINLIPMRRYPSNSSSLRHSSSARSVSERPSYSSSVGPSRKRCRSPSDLVSLVAPTPGALSLVCADLLPPRNRVRGFVSATDSEASLEESYESYTEPDINFDVQADIDACIAATDAIAAREADVIVETEDEVDEEAESSARGTVEIGVDRVTHPVVRMTLLSLLERELYYHMVEIPVHRFSVIKSVQRDQGHRIMATSQQSAAMSERIGTLEWDNIRLRGMLGVEKQRVDRLWHSMSQNGDDNDNGSGGNGNQGNNNGDGNQNGKMEMVRENGIGVSYQQLFVETIGIDEAYEMSWTDLMKLMIEVYYPRNEIQKLENEL
ncbi:hypothetical protein Tco_0509728 [Tanacetum coccineum]